MNSRRKPGDAARALIDGGLEHYGRGDEGKAIDCWQRALGVAPGNAEALEYLEAAGVEPEPPTAEIIDLDARRSAPKTVPPPKGSVLNSPALLEMIKKGDHESALEMLYDARTETPNDSSISRSVRHLKVHLAKKSLKRLGGVDVVPAKRVGSEGEIRGNEEQSVYELVDGFSSISDILRMSRLGQLPTLRALAALVERGLLEAVEHDDLLVLDTPRESVPTPPPSSSAVVGPEPAPAEESRDSRYAKLFSDAMEAYFDRDLAKARAGLEECCVLRPADTQARHNLERLKALEAEQ